MAICLASGATSCAIKDALLGPPEPTVLEEQQLPYKVAILPFVNKTTFWLPELPRSRAFCN
jgi:hypothetical protein